MKRPRYVQSPAFVLTMIAGFLAGCSTSRGRDTKFVVQAELEAANPLQTTTFELLDPPELVFLRYEGSSNQAHVLRRQTATEQFGAQVETVDLINNEPVRSLYWSRNDRGDSVLHATVEHDENALTLFDPPLLLLPAILIPGNPVHAESSMRVLRADDPRRLRERGTGHQTITYVGRRRISTSSEQIESHYFEIEFRADLRLADVQETTFIYRTDAGATVVEESRQTLSVLGFPADRTQVLLIRDVGLTIK